MHKPRVGTLLPLRAHSVTPGDPPLRPVGWYRPTKFQMSQKLPHTVHSQAGLQTHRTEALARALEPLGLQVSAKEPCEEPGSD